MQSEAIFRILCNINDNCNVEIHRYYQYLFGMLLNHVAKAKKKATFKRFLPLELIQIGFLIEKNVTIFNSFSALFLAIFE